MSILLKIYKFQVNSPIAIFWKYFCGINVFRGMLILTVNSIGSGLHLCTVWVANIISLGLVFFMYFLLRILKLIKNYFTKSLAFDAGRNWDHGRTRRWNNKFEETNLVGNVLVNYYGLYCHSWPMFNTTFVQTQAVIHNRLEQYCKKIGYRPRSAGWSSLNGKLNPIYTESITALT